MSDLREGAPDEDSERPSLGLYDENEPKSGSCVGDGSGSSVTVVAVTLTERPWGLEFFLRGPPLADRPELDPDVEVPGMRSGVAERTSPLPDSVGIIEANFCDTVEMRFDRLCDV